MSTIIVSIMISQARFQSRRKKRPATMAGIKKCNRMCVMGSFGYFIAGGFMAGGFMAGGTPLTITATGDAPFFLFMPCPFHACILSTFQGPLACPCGQSRF